MEETCELNLIDGGLVTRMKKMVTRGWCTPPVGGLSSSSSSLSMFGKTIGQGNYKNMQGCELGEEAKRS